jgi:hypothetical protein
VSGAISPSTDESEIKPWALVIEKAKETKKKANRNLDIFILLYFLKIINFSV